MKISSQSSKEIQKSSRSSTEQLSGVTFSTIHPERFKILSQTKLFNNDGQCVVYWMSRDQRIDDNYALICAHEIATQRNVPLKIVFNLVPKFLQATLRQYGFMIKGLKETELKAREKNIQFILTRGDPLITLPSLVSQVQPVAVICDFSPMRVGRMWTEGVASRLDALPSPLPLIQVDAHNVVPCWAASDKLEYAARTIRTKIHRRLSEFLLPFPPLDPLPEGSLEDVPPMDWEEALASLQIDRTVVEVDGVEAGSQAGMRALEVFLDEKLKDYADKRNDPNMEVTSGLSPYLHFGQLSAQRAILDTQARGRHPSSSQAFIEEILVRRELADNFCYYNPHYDSLAGAWAWAKETLTAHSGDKREVVYSQSDLEGGLTHDPLWNASQLQLLREGRMQGFLRMYWAKKILEWTPSPETALSTAILLNDKYQLDGRDPNGYVGCMWSIGRRGVQ